MADVKALTHQLQLYESSILIVTCDSWCLLSIMFNAIQDFCFSLLGLSVSYALRLYISGSVSLSSSNKSSIMLVSTKQQGCHSSTPEQPKKYERPPCGLVCLKTVPSWIVLRKELFRNKEDFIVFWAKPAIFLKGTLTRLPNILTVTSSQKSICILFLYLSSKYFKRTNILRPSITMWERPVSLKASALRAMAATVGIVRPNYICLMSVRLIGPQTTDIVSWLIKNRVSSTIANRPADVESYKAKLFRFRADPFYKRLFGSKREILRVKSLNFLVAVESLQHKMSVTSSSFLPVMEKWYFTTSTSTSRQS